eukprot:snap_masked-scaffold_1-processed-gene-11.9-mRNA-1 protein AED:1.00 eAED:1.00 QI:0/-1/0/0/-1/1/1/0/1086
MRNKATSTPTFKIPRKVVLFFSFFALYFSLLSVIVFLSKSKVKSRSGRNTNSQKETTRIEEAPKRESIKERRDRIISERKKRIEERKRRKNLEKIRQEAEIKQKEEDKEVREIEEIIHSSYFYGTDDISEEDFNFYASDFVELTTDDLKNTLTLSLDENKLLDSFSPEEVSDSNPPIFLIIQFFYEERIKFLQQIIEHYLSFMSFEKIIVIWNDYSIPIPNNINKLIEKNEVHLIISKKNSLNNRYILSHQYLVSNYDSSSLEHSLIFLHDDDLALNKNNFFRMIQLWLRNKDKAISHFIRYLSSEEYQSEPTKFPQAHFSQNSYGHSSLASGGLVKFNMGIRVLGFSPKFLKAYSDLDNKILRFIDEDEGHCDDVLFNLVLSKESGSPPIRANFEENSVHDYHFHSFRGDKREDRALSSDLSSVAEFFGKHLLPHQSKSISRRKQRIRCFSVLQEMMETELQEGFVSLSAATSKVFGENPYLVHPCLKLVHHPSVSNKLKYIPNNPINQYWKQLNNFDILGENKYKQFKTKGYLKLSETIQFEHNLQDVFSEVLRYSIASTKNIFSCFLENELCKKFVRETNLISSIKKYIFEVDYNQVAETDIGVVHLEAFEVEKTDQRNKFDNIWQTNKNFYNSCSGNIICILIPVRNTLEAVFKVMNTSHLMPPITNLFTVNHLLEKDEPQILSCAKSLDSDSAVDILDFEKAIVFSNELWYQIHVDSVNPAQFIKICFLPLKVCQLPAEEVENRRGVYQFLPPASLNNPWPVIPQVSGEKYSLGLGVPFRSFLSHFNLRNSKLNSAAETEEELHNLLGLISTQLESPSRFRLSSLSLKPANSDPVNVKKSLFFFGKTLVLDILSISVFSVNKNMPAYELTSLKRNRLIYVVEGELALVFFPKAGEDIPTDFENFDFDQEDKLSNYLTASYSNFDEKFGVTKTLSRGSVVFIPEDTFHLVAATSRGSKFLQFDFSVLEEQDHSTKSSTVLIQEGNVDFLDAHVKFNHKLDVSAESNGCRLTDESEGEQETFIFYENVQAGDFWIRSSFDDIEEHDLLYFPMVEERFQDVTELVGPKRNDAKGRCLAVSFKRS